MAAMRGPRDRKLCGRLGLQWSVKAGSRLHYAWIVAAIGFVIMLVGAGVRASPTMFVQAMQREFH